MQFMALALSFAIDVVDAYRNLYASLGILILSNLPAPLFYLKSQIVAFQFRLLYKIKKIFLHFLQLLIFIF
jgi:hypothetical protein